MEVQEGKDEVYRQVAYLDIEMALSKRLQDSISTVNGLNIKKERPVDQRTDPMGNP